MYQTFEPQGGPQVGRANLPRLRRALTPLLLDGFIIPHEDEYQNEYVPPALDRLAWATGFTGSAGAAVVMKDKAVVLVDGRYTLQVRAQVDPRLFSFEDLVELGLSGWLRREAKRGQRIGYDPKLFSPDGLERLRAAAKEVGFELIAISPNPIDGVWADRPPIPAEPVVAHPEKYTGESSAAKRKRLGDGLANDRVDAAIITSPASLAWLFNIRGGDVARTPLPLGAAILYADGTADLFMNPDKLSAETRRWLGNEVSLRAETEFEDGMRATGQKRVRVDPASASSWHVETLVSAGAEIARGMDPVTLPRACKNAVEIEGARAAHARDGAAVSRYLHWLASEAQSGKVDEITACKVLEDYRRENGALKDLSFDSISGAGPNGAVVHYRVNQKTNLRLRRGSLFLIDSGGQYLDGTTDITRTVAIGRPTSEMRSRFTCVLKGHIALSRVRFPKGTTGSQLDALARMGLWDIGLDYDHGTGHGVGSYLGVHEGPHRIAKAGNTIALETGMIVSNEPGYYKTGEYGIRIENLQVVTAPAPIPGGEKDMYGFETLTLAPIDRTLIDRRLLDARERDWLNAYHARVRDVIGPQLSGADRDWLDAATATI
jgi:Xaa-Pro aminopeptidase